MIRFRERADREIIEAYLYIASLSSIDNASEWREGLYEEIATLAVFPRRCSRVPEQFTLEVRQFIYRRGRNRAAYRVLFTITNEESDALDPPTVTIIHLRHASTRAVTRREIREIEGSG